MKKEASVSHWPLFYQKKTSKGGRLEIHLNDSIEYPMQAKAITISLRKYRQT